MASILDRYGIKEVADVTFYEINKQTGERGAPVLYLDTLKVSTIEQTAEQTEARGGKGNPPLIIWDYGKEINVTLEDALFSAKSMAIMFGNGTPAVSNATSTIYKTINWTATGTAYPTTGGYTMNGKTYKVTSATIYDADGSTAASASVGTNYMVTLALEAKTAATTIEISPNTFPGTYYVTGDTYARNEVDGSDEFFQFVIPKAKVQSENTITLEAEGDPSVFNLSLRVLRPKSGAMMQLIKYDLTQKS